MIIKNVPFRLPLRQSLICWHYARPVVLRRSARASYCGRELFRPYVGLSKLEAYQVRAVRYLVRRRARSVCDWFGVHDGLMHAGGVL